MPDGNSQLSRLDSRLEFLSFSKRVRPFLQASFSECGLACVFMIAEYHNAGISLRELRDRIGNLARGTTLKQIMNLLDSLQLESRALKCDLHQLRQIRTPFIAHWNMNHFLVVDKVSKNSVTVCDPAVGRQKMTWDEFSGGYTGVSLEIWPSQTYQEKRNVTRASPRDFLFVGRDAANLLILSFFFNIIFQCVFVLGLTLTQVLIDQAIDAPSASIFWLIFFGFFTLKVIEVLLNLAKQFFSQIAGNIVGFHMNHALVSHLFRLDFQYIENRSIGDLQDRFKSLQPIKNWAINAAIPAGFDLILCLIAFLVMCFYTITLSLGIVGAILIYIIFKHSFTRIVRIRDFEALRSSGLESSAFVENLRSFRTIRSNQLWPIQKARWSNAFIEMVNNQFSAQVFRLWFSSVSEIIKGITLIAVATYAAYLVGVGELTVGMMTAYLAYTAAFTIAAIRVIDTLFDYQLLKAHSDRLSDISEQKVVVKPFSQGHTSNNDIQLSGISFRYDNGPAIFRRFDLNIPEGRKVLVYGPSGSGKSTLLRLLRKELKPQLGRITLGGVDISELPDDHYFAGMGSMVQNDGLLTGNILENISGFQETPNFDLIRDAATRACVYDEIASLPMGFQTPIGGIYAPLSGGQIQRICLARALFKCSKLLLLDEPTANLDAASAHRVLCNIMELDCSVVCVSHFSDAKQIFGSQSIINSDSFMDENI